MPVIPIEDFRDPRVDVFRDLPTAHLTRYSGLFVAEGEKLVRRLAESDYSVRSVVAEATFVELAKEIIGERAPIYVLERAPLLELVSFKFHRGLLACGERKAPATCAGWIDELPSHATLIACDKVCDPENLGGILRNAAAFGVDGVIIGRGCADPFSRRVLRVSMGTAFKLRIAQCGDLASELMQLRSLGFETIGAMLAPQAVELEKATRASRSVLVLGNEGHGLAEDVAAACSKKVKLEMRRELTRSMFLWLRGFFFITLCGRWGASSRFLACASGHDEEAALAYASGYDET